MTRLIPTVANDRVAFIHTVEDKQRVVDYRIMYVDPDTKDLYCQHAGMLVTITELEELHGSESIPVDDGEELGDDNQTLRRLKMRRKLRRTIGIINRLR